MEGKGILFYKNGDRNEGQFKNGKIVWKNYILNF